MKLLTRLGSLGRSGGLISFVNRQRPQIQQSRRSSIHVYPIPCRRHMATTVAEREPSGMASAQAPVPAADDTRWMILERWCCTTNSAAIDVVAGADAKTVAETHTSRGPLRVSLSRATPPAISFLCFEGSGGKSHGDGFTHALIAAHRDSVLLGFGNESIVYKAAAGGNPPSLSLLPACHVPMYEGDPEREELYDYDSDSGEVSRTERQLDQMDTGLLRCGDGEDGGGGEFLVAQLQVAYKAPFDTAELCVLRPGRRDWEFHEAVPIVHHESGGGRRHDLGRWQALNAAVPAGNRFLCWASYDHSTLLVCDMMAEAELENTKLRYVPLPVKAVPPKENEWDDDDDEHENQLSWLYYRTIGAVPPPAGADAAVRFVSIDRRCCCGAPVIRSACEHSSSAFTVTTWTLALTTTTTGEEDEPMAWVKEGVLDCEEFWALLAGYQCEGLPRGAWPTRPVVSSENPDVVCFLVDEVDMDSETKGQIWTLEVDMRRKTLISVVRCPPHPVRNVTYCNPLPAKLHSSLLNARTN